MTKRTWSDEQFIAIIADCSSFSEVMKVLGLKESGSGRTRMQEHAKRLNLDTSHFTGRAHWKGKTREHHNKWISDKDVFSGDVVFNTNTKRRFLNEVEYKCLQCGIDSWNEKKLTLQVDHIDGDRRNNSLENLRLLCPNCHSQTETWGRSKKFLREAAEGGIV